MSISRGARLQNVRFVHFAMLSMIIENKHNIGITIDMKSVYPKTLTLTPSLTLTVNMYHISNPNSESNKKLLHEPDIL